MSFQDEKAGTNEAARTKDHERRHVMCRGLAALGGAAQVQKAEPQTMAGAPAANERPRPSRGEAVSSPAHRAKSARKVKPAKWKPQRARHSRRAHHNRGHHKAARGGGPAHVL